jgi:hypothetical protein
LSSFINAVTMPRSGFEADGRFAIHVTSSDSSSPGRTGLVKPHLVPAAGRNDAILNRDAVQQQRTNRERV